MQSTSLVWCFLEYDVVQVVRVVQALFVVGLFSMLDYVALGISFPCITDG